MDEWCLLSAEDEEQDPEAEARRGKCRPGDHVSAPRARGLYRHHGILLDGDEVWHVNAGVFSGPLVCCGLRPAMVRIDPVVRFLKGNEQLTLERRGAVDLLALEGLRAKTGATTQYDLLFCNCEHYATGAGGDDPVSWQSRRVALVVTLAALVGATWGAGAGGVALLGLGRGVADGTRSLGCECGA